MTSANYETLTIDTYMNNSPFDPISKFKVINSEIIMHCNLQLVCTTFFPNCNY